MGNLVYLFSGDYCAEALSSSFSAGCSWCPPGTNIVLKMGQSLWITTTTVVNNMTLKCLMAVNGIMWIAGRKGWTTISHLDPLRETF